MQHVGPVALTRRALVGVTRGIATTNSWGLAEVVDASHLLVEPVSAGSGVRLRRLEITGVIGSSGPREQAQVLGVPVETVALEATPVSPRLGRRRRAAFARR